MKNILPIAFILFFLIGCTEKQVSTDIPYTVQIKQIRSYYKALDIEQRLEGMGVSTYIISEATEDGDWYRIVSGAEKSLADIQELKEKIQNKIGIDDLEIINYQTIESNVIVNFKQDLKEKKRITSVKPDLPEKIFNIIDKFPADGNFIVKSFFIVNCPDSLKDMRDFREGYNVKHDLPRGISMKPLMKRSECIAEVIYEDNLFEDQITIDIIQLKKDHGIEVSDHNQMASMFPVKSNSQQHDIANYFAELILATDNYSFEDKVEISISSYQNFSGYKVTLKPSKSKDIYRTYFVLVSKDLRYLVFSQSTKKTEDEIIEIIEHLGSGEGLNSYDEFYNAFYTLPSSIDDAFICFSTHKLTSRYAKSKGYAKWAKEMVGHWVTSAHFYGEEKRGYNISLFDLLKNSKVMYIEDLYIQKHKSSSSTYEIDVHGITGVASKDRYPHELSWGEGRHSIAINNSDRKSRLFIEDMLRLASLMQLDN